MDKSGKIIPLFFHTNAVHKKEKKQRYMLQCPKHAILFAIWEKLKVRMLLIIKDNNHKLIPIITIMKNKKQ